MPDKRIVYSVSGTWWDSIANVGRAPNGLPCCPHCGSMLFEMEDDVRWWEGARRYEADGHPGYVDMLEWGRGKCVPNLAALTAAWKKSLTD